MSELKTANEMGGAVTLPQVNEDQGDIVAPMKPSGENGEPKARAKSQSGREGTGASSKPKGEKAKRESKPKPKAEKPATISRAKPKAETKPKVENGGGASATKPKREPESLASKAKTSGENKRAEPKPKVAREPIGAVSTLTYLSAGACNVGLVAVISFALLTYFRVPNDTLWAYLIGPLQALGLVLSTMGVYTVFKGVDFGRVVPWVWALGGLGLVVDLNVFWPELYADLAIPSKILGILSFVGGVFLLKVFFRKRGQMSIKKGPSGLKMLVVGFALLGAFLPLASEFQYLLPDSLYSLLVGNMPEVGYLVLWPMDYFGISGEIESGFGSGLNNEDVVGLTSSVLKVGSNMVVFAVLAFVMGWAWFGRRASRAA